MRRTICLVTGVTTDVPEISWITGVITAYWSYTNYWSYHGLLELHGLLESRMHRTIQLPGNRLLEFSRIRTIGIPVYGKYIAIWGSICRPGGLFNSCI